MNSRLIQGNFYLRNGNILEAIKYYLQALKQRREFNSVIIGNLMLAKKKYSSSNKNNQSVAVCGWDLGHNAAGRVYTLAKLYQTFCKVEIIGSIFERNNCELWKPIRNTAIVKNFFIVNNEKDFIDQAVNLVASHPYDIVHLSKPRLPNILFGILYKLIWDSKVIMDIDDEELSFVGADIPVFLDSFKSREKINLNSLDGKFWTQVAVGLSKEFDGVTVSNSLLKNRYGGEIIYHARDQRYFKLSPKLRCESRKFFNISINDKVVLFYGTPRRHKGLIETAEAIAELKRDDIVFVIVGDFHEVELQIELKGIKGVNYKFVGDQSFDFSPNVLAIADVCVLLQDPKSPVSEFQIPAKLFDSLTMGINFITNNQLCKSDLNLDEFFIEHYADLPNKLLELINDKKITSHFSNETKRKISFFENADKLKTLIKVEKKTLSYEFENLYYKIVYGTVYYNLLKLVKIDYKIVVFTCIMGNYESVKEPLYIDARVDYLLFTDNENLKSEKWTIMKIDNIFDSPRRNSRLPKILAHKYLPKHSVSVYIDSSMELKVKDVHKMVDECLETSDIALYEHHIRNNIYDEISFCNEKSSRNVSDYIREKTALKYKKSGYPKSFGLFENGFIIRKNNSKIQRLNDEWFSEYTLGSERDQFTLMYCLWKLNVNVNAIKVGEECRKNPYVNFEGHKYVDYIERPSGKLVGKEVADKGVLLIAFGFDYESIAPHLLKTIRQYSNIPVHVCTNIPYFMRSKGWLDFENISFEYFPMNDDENRILKTQLSKYTIFEKTLYIDVDSEVLSEKFLEPFGFLNNETSIICPVWNIFSEKSLLEKSRSSNKIKKFLKTYNDLDVKGKIKFVGGGVCYFKKNECLEIFEKFHEYWIEFGKLEDMPALNKAVYENKSKLKIIDNKEYNSTSATVIKSLHASNLKIDHMDNFVRKRYNDAKDTWSFVRQGTTELFSKKKVLIPYDLVGWAFYDISFYLKKYLNNYYEVDLVDYNNLNETDLKKYDLIVLHTYSFLKYISKENWSKVALGFSSHKRENYNDFPMIKYRFSNDEYIFNCFLSKNKFYVPNGVDTNFFLHKVRNLHGNLRVGCVGSLSWAEHKGKYRVSEICKKTETINKSMFVNPYNALTKKEMLIYYDEVDLFIVSSVSETGPNPLLEAMSCGIPCISNKVGIAEKLIVNGYNGFLIDDYDDIDSYIKYVNILKNNKNLYETLSKNGKKSIKNFDWGLQYMNYKNMIDKVLSSN